MSQRLLAKARPAAGALLAGLLLSQAPPAARLDAEQEGVGGIRFGEPAEAVAGLRLAFNGFGTRWQTTKRYTRLGDTTRFAKAGLPPTYWFRQNRFIGIDVRLPSAAAVAQQLAQLTARYGPARPDTLPGHWYWLGHHSYILLERGGKRDGTLFVASLAMLNEQVYETAVRARARRLAQWRPDSLGLPRQFPSR